MRVESTKAAVQKTTRGSDEDTQANKGIRQFSGTIDEVEIHNEILSKEELIILAGARFSGSAQK